MKSKVTSIFIVILVHSANIALGQRSLQLISLINQRENSNASTKQLFLGDKVAMDQITFNSIKNYSKTVLKLSDFKSKKLIIIDFWSKYCSFCIENMPKMQEIQKQFNNDIQILLVTDNTEKELSSLFTRSLTLKHIDLPFVFGDTILTHQLFPHIANPYQVWIDNKGEVLATTSHTEVNENSISKYLENKTINVVQRFDENNSILVDIKTSKKSLLDIQNGRFKENILYYATVPTLKTAPSLTLAHSSRIEENLKEKSSRQYSFFLNRMPPLGIGPNTDTLTNELGEKVGLKIPEYSLTFLLLAAYNDIVLKADVKKLHLSDSTRSYFEEIKDTTNISRYLGENTFSYESSMEGFSREKSLKILKLDIERCFGLKLTLENKSIRCAILRMTDSMKFKKAISLDTNLESEIIKEKHQIRAVNYPVGRFLASIREDNRSTEDPIIVDQTNVKNNERLNITLNISQKKLSIDNLLLINKELDRYGLKFYTEYRPMNILVLHNSF